MKEIEHFIFGWVNFAILFAGLFILIKHPLREFLDSRREKTRLLMDKTRRDNEDAQSKYGEAKNKLANAYRDADKLVESLTQMGTYGRDSQIKKAKDTAERILRDTRETNARELLHARERIKIETLILSFDRAEEILKRGVSKEDQSRLLDGSFAAMKRTGIWTR